MARDPARFPHLKEGYESFYLRAVDPERPRGVWLRHTITVPPGGDPVGSIWLTVFDAARDAPLTRKWSRPGPRPLEPTGVEIAGSRFGEATVAGGVEDASWDLTWTPEASELRHLPKAWMYRAPVPRTKLVSPVPSGRFSGAVTVGDERIELDGWPGMVGHNWGAEHAERWIWLHGTAFPEAPGAWLDVAIGRVKVAGATTPWIANGELAIGDRRLRIGGVGGGGLRARVVEDPLRLDLEVRGEGGLRLEATVHSLRPQTTVWRYADPDGAQEHHVANCSIAELDLVLLERDGVPVHIRTPHGAAYELGMRETTHGLPLQPFTDPA